jgi:uncharacterized membrane protein YsdA (DUF1294 family)
VRLPWVLACVVTLHLLDLFGGWPGGVLAQQAFRHKTRKRAFQAWTWLIVALHVAGWSWYLSIP